MTWEWWDLGWITSPVWLVINALCAFRLTRLITVDMLPPLPVWRARLERWAFDRWEPERVQREVNAGMDREPTAEEYEQLAKWRQYGGQPPLAYLITCPWCAGYWVALLVFLAATVLPAPLWVFVSVPLAVSAVVGLLSTHTE